MSKMLVDFIEQNTLASLQRSTRIHQLNSYIQSPHFYIKREDELSSGVIGSKWRKYTSLLHFLGKEKYQEVVVIGGENSNNIVSILQLLNEHCITSHPHILKKNSPHISGNALWLRILCPEKNIVWIERKDWANVEKIAHAYAHNKHCFVIPEGANTIEALPGAMTLAYDIKKNEQQNNIFFDNIFIDSGTGLSSIAMILTFLILGETNRQFFVTLLAGSQQEYLNYLQKYALYLEQKLDIKISAQNPNIHFYNPPTAKSFGSINQEVLTTIKQVAEQEGILIDPIYSAKHFLTVAQISKTQALTGNSLLVYNGGSFALSGFQRALQ